MDPRIRLALATLVSGAMLEPGPGLAQRPGEGEAVRIQDYRSGAAPTGTELRLVLLKEFAGGSDSATMTAYSTAMRLLSSGRFAIAVNPPRAPARPPGSPISAYRLPPDAPPARTGIRLYDSTGQLIRMIGRSGSPSAAPLFSGDITSIGELPDGKLVAGTSSYRWAALTENDGVVGNPRMSPYSLYGSFSDGSVLEGIRGVVPGSDVYVGGIRLVTGTLSRGRTTR